MTKRFVSDYHDQVVQMHKDGYRLWQIGKVIGVGRQAVSNYLEKVGVREKHWFRKHFYNEKFFDKINTEEKSYVLGFWYADGCNSPEERKVKLSLHKKDEDTLRKIANAIGYNESFIDDPQPKKKTHMKILSLDSVYMSKSIAAAGCVKAKTFKIRLPIDVVPGHLMHHFIRGYFDGDGSIGRYERYYRMSFGGNKKFLSDLQTWLSVFDIVSGITSCKHADERYRYLNISNKNVKNLIQLMYHDATIYMDRKHDRAMDAMSARRKG